MGCNCRSAQGLCGRATVRTPRHGHGMVDIVDCDIVGGEEKGRQVARMHLTHGNTENPEQVTHFRTREVISATRGNNGQKREFCVVG